MLQIWKLSLRRQTRLVFVFQHSLNVTMANLLQFIRKLSRWTRLKGFHPCFESICGGFSNEDPNNCSIGGDKAKGIHFLEIDFLLFLILRHLLTEVRNTLEEPWKPTVIMGWGGPLPAGMCVWLTWDCFLSIQILNSVSQAHKSFQKWCSEMLYENAFEPFPSKVHNIQSLEGSRLTNDPLFV